MKDRWYTVRCSSAGLDIVRLVILKGKVEDVLLTLK